jgi:hypothetical protein
MSGVVRIISVGIKNWILGFAAMDAFDCRFVGCTVAFLDTALMVPAFTRGRQILSIRPVFSCDACRHEDAVLVDIVDKVAQLPPKVVCRKCGEEMLADPDLESDLEMLFV